MQFNHGQAQALDAKLRREYYEIEILQSAINNFSKISSPSKVQVAIEPEIITRLKLDINGIFLSVLISHGIFGQAKGFIKKLIDICKTQNRADLPRQALFCVISLSLLYIYR